MKKIAVVAHKDCASCGSCVQICPRRAIHIYHGIYAKVSPVLCIGCGLCAKACPGDIITMKEVKPLGEKEKLV